MAVRQEIKSQLARLLATEDLVVEHKQVTSAQFNVHTRVLILPLWERISNTAYDMLVGHEVGHALFTPDVDWSLDLKVPQQFVNVVEDARIEKLMKRKYLGLAKTFFNGYKELHEKDFFELDGEDITGFNLADRANLHFKVGHFLDLAFLPAEKEIIDMIGRCETFADTKKAAFVLYQHCLDQQKIEHEEKVKNHEQAKMFYDECMENAGVEEPVPFEDDEMSDAWDDAPEVHTVDTLESKLQELVNDNGTENEYIEIPKVDLSKVVISNSEVHDEIDRDWEYQQQQISINPFIEVDEQYAQFKQDAQKEVSYLVKEFECRKSASAYARASTDRTGVLDTTKLQTYRFNEDLFKRVTVLPDGKSHGLIFILDWSGSMGTVLEDTVKQLYNLVWFCSKVQIPFDVYAFTDGYGQWKHKDELPLPRMKKEEGKLYVNDQFSLMNIFTSKVSRNILEKQMKSFWRVTFYLSMRMMPKYDIPLQYRLSGTPLNESLISLHQIIPQFKKENRVQKVQCVILTDGESNALPYHKIVQRYWEDEPYMGCRNISPHHTYLRNRKTGHTYQFGYKYWEFSEVLLEDLKETFSDTNFIGIRLLSSGEFGKFVRRYDSHIEDRVMRQATKDKCYITTDGGYHSYFGILSSSLFNDESFEVEDDASKSRIKNAFIKSLKNKKLNKKILGEFIDLVA